MSIHSRGPHRPRSRVPSNCRYLFQSAACAQIHIQGAGMCVAEGVVAGCCCSVLQPLPSNCRYAFQSAACAQIHVQGAGVYAAEGVVVRCCCAGWYCSVLLQCVAVCCSRRLSTFQLLLPVSVGCVPNTHPRCMCVCCRLLLQVCMLQVVVVGTCCRVLQPFHMPQLQCVAVCCSVLRYVTVCVAGRVLQGVAGCCSHSICPSCGVLQRVTVFYSLL